ncbi:hypothetical protein J5N97_017957 [Dioscorea zingiberensis]|uniref:phosphatidate phosphatase n=1 Tax=Dioscorea zingiberensis TaxID=325984 RepID=A0A9D5HH69_9LILI|nr:hypothetical protein J5N97_017957 [Dioscorea zingiberensis]
MYAVERLGSLFTRGVYTVSGPFHPFGGAVDIIIVQQPDGSFKSSPWYVRFGKFQGVLKTKEKVVNIYVNGTKAGFHMYLDHKGEAYFLKDHKNEEGDFSASSASSGDEKDEKTKNGKFRNIQSLNFDGSQIEQGAQTDPVNGKSVTRTNSKRGRILGLMFGRRSTKEDDSCSNVERVSSMERAEIAADLLEMKWSTNLPTKDRRLDNYTDKNCPKAHSPEDDLRPVERSNSNGEGISNNFEDHEEAPEVDISEKGIASTDENKDVSVQLKLDTDEFADTLKESALEESVIDAQSAVFLDASLEPIGSHIKRFSHDPVANEQTHETSEEITAHSQFLIAHEEVLEFHSEVDNADHLIEVISNEVTIRTDVATCDSAVESEEIEPTPLIYHETLESTKMRHDVSTDLVSNVKLSSDSSEQSALHEEHVCETNELISEIIQPESGASIHLETMEKHHQHNVDVYNFEDSSKRANKLESNYALTSESSCHLEEEEEENLKSRLNEDTSSLPNGFNISQEHDPSYTSEDALECSIPLSENLEEDQFLFSDLDSFVAKGNNLEQLTDDMPVEKGHHSMIDLGGVVGFEDLTSTQAFEQLSNVSRTQTSPINIPRTRTNFEETELLTRSLPNIRSHIHDLEKSNCLHSLSCSVETNPEEYNMDVLKSEYISSSKLEAASESDKAQGQSTPAGVASDECNTIPIIPDVEVSLCKHLLYEGMGADAANEAFNSAKVNVEEISALGPSLVKNDKLVVKIRGHYFPWDAAAPIILRMISFGQEHVFEHQGMIAVDRAEKNLKADTMNGSWRLWPFNFKKSKSISSVQSTPESTILIDSKSTDSSRNLSGDKFMQKLNVVKKVQSLTPSSEEIATLDLKEGRNVVTFSFSTAMLGQQQVDARIYLWKWNTRIVVSDVDGTITKSDVLGQFMPLVGVDWSQTGVAHLFSAIKENGYQLLFLSARAISQAYLTRQFLFNLKQEGKALPDGPVVISPDGLFPSLYREVIRRAPHEFKIQCLEDIKAVFPSDCNPFYAGFGNRDTDEISYLKVGIPKGKIFIINPKGEVAVNRRVDTRSYTSLHALVNGMFPAMTYNDQEDYNSWNFWRLPLPAIDM